MPTVGIRNESAQAIGSTDHLSINDRNFCVDIYNTSSETFVSETVLGLNTIRFNPVPEIFSLASNILTIAEAGYYLFLVRVALSMTGGGAGQAAVSLQQDPATGTFAAITGGLGYIFLPASLNFSFQMAIPVLAGANYRYRLTSIRTSGAGNVQTVNNTTCLSAIRLYKNG